MEGNYLADESVSPRPGDENSTLSPVEFQSGDELMSADLEQIDERSKGHFCLRFDAIGCRL